MNQLPLGPFSKCATIITSAYRQDIDSAYRSNLMIFELNENTYSAQKG